MTGPGGRVGEHGERHGVSPRTDPAARPRLGFIGLGWIGGARLRAVLDAGAADVAALCDPDPERLEEWGERCRRASRHREAEDLLVRASELGLDGVVLATPNALHAPHAHAALEHGLALFVQKPLGLDAAEVEDIVRQARKEDLLVEVDYTYRNLGGARMLRERVRAGDLGGLDLVEAVFHNAYGPDKAWCFDRALSGGGALLDLGVHLLDLVFWIVGPARPRVLGAHVRETAGAPGIDCFTAADLVLEPDLPMRLTSSWHAHAGRDCDFRLTLHGAAGGAELRNRDGGFYNFELALRRGRSEETVATDARSWMDHGILSWIERVRAGDGFDAELETSVLIARTVDAINGQSRRSGPGDAVDGASFERRGAPARASR